MAGTTLNGSALYLVRTDNRRLGACASLSTFRQAHMLENAHFLFVGRKEREKGGEHAQGGEEDMNEWT